MQKTRSSKYSIRNILIALYVLVVLGFSATARAQMEIKPIFVDYKPAQAQTFVGNIAMTPNQEFYLVVSETEVYQLAANIDLSEFNGQLVAVDAYKAKHNSSNFARSSTLDPLPGDDREAKEVPVLVIIGISEIAN